MTRPTPENVEEPIDRPCDTCEGFGNLKAWGMLGASTARCSDCNGTGRTWILRPRDATEPPVGGTGGSVHTHKPRGYMRE